MNIKDLYLKFEAAYQKVVYGLLIAAALAGAGYGLLEYSRSVTRPYVEVIDGHEFIVYPEGDLWTKEIVHRLECSACKRESRGDKK